MRGQRGGAVPLFDESTEQSDVAPRPAGPEAGTGPGIPAPLFVLLLVLPLVLLLVLLTSAPAHGTTVADVAQEIPDAKLVWEAGNYIYHSTVGSWNPQQIKPGYRPKWSPDGTRIAYSVSDRFYVMNADFTGETELITGIKTSWWGTAYSWTRDGQYVTVLMSDQRTVRKVDASSGSSTVIYTDPSQNLGEAAEIDVTGRYLILFRGDPNHIRVWDLQNGLAVTNSADLGRNCTPAWAPDGSYFSCTDSGSSRPIMKVDFNPSGPSMSNPSYFIGMDGVYGAQYVCHFSRISNEGNWLVLSGKEGAGSYNVYLWKIGDPKENLVQMTTGGGQSPDIYVPAGGPPSVAILSFTANPSTIIAGQSATLSWDTSNADSVAIDQGIGGVSLDGSRSVSPGSTTIYTLTAQGTGGPKTKQVTVMVGTAPQSPAAPSGLAVQVSQESQGIAVNAGGSQAPVAGWENDDPYAQGNLFDFQTLPDNMGDLTDPAPPGVYPTVRHSNPIFNFGSVQNGVYAVRIHFYDDWSAADGRAFTVTIEGQAVLTGYSIMQASGGLGKAVIEDFTVTVSDGNGMQIEFDKAGGLDAFCSAIEILGDTLCSAALSWQDSSDDETGFRIERREGGGSYVEVAVVGANVTTYTDGGLAPATTYTYRVFAYNAAGDSVPSGEQTVTTPDGTGPEPTVITNPAAGGAEFVEGSIAVFDGAGTSLVWTYDIASDGQGPAQFGTGPSASLVIPTGLSLPTTITVTLTGGGGTDEQTHTIIAATEPTVTVTSPNGGEILFPGQEWHVRWEAVEVSNVTITYSADGGGTWEVIVLTLLETDAQWGDYTWTVPDTISAQCAISVADYSGSPSDQSDGAFQISPDADADGLPDSWEILYFGDAASCDPSGDADGDGYSNLDEYNGGSDPTSAASVPLAHGGGSATGLGCAAGGTTPAAFLLLLAIAAAVAVGRPRGCSRTISRLFPAGNARIARP